MKNLAGDKECDVIILEELKQAGIKPIEIGKRERREVPSAYIGIFHDFVFSRAWYYWVVTGHVPLYVAQIMYDRHKDLAIRVAGHCGNPPPEDWCQPRDYEEVLHKLWEEVDNDLGKHEEIKAKMNEYEKGKPMFVSNYHIDTQEGLNKFVEIMKEFNVMG